MPEMEFTIDKIYKARQQARQAKRKGIEQGIEQGKMDMVKRLLLDGVCSAPEKNGQPSSKGALQLLLFISQS